MTPSSPAPSKRRNQSSASARSRVAGERCTGGVAPASACSSRSRRAASGTSRRSSSPSASRSQATNDAGVCSASSFTRDAAGWMRRSSASKSSPLVADDDDLAVDDAALGKRRRERRDQLREVAVHRLLVAALQQDLVAVAEHQRAEAVPLRLELPAFARSGRASAALDSIGASGGSKGSFMDDRRSGARLAAILRSPRRRAADSPGELSRVRSVGVDHPHLHAPQGSRRRAARRAAPSSTRQPRRATRRARRVGNRWPGSSQPSPAGKRRSQLAAWRGS